MGTSRPDILRRRLDVRGQVQGVGFRPFVYRLAREFGLAGYVANNNLGAIIEVEGPAQRLAEFEQALLERLPPLARITELRRRRCTPLGETAFRIQPSHREPGRRPEVTPDAATCPDCLREMNDPADRRFRYPFINCTNCGPRYSIIRTLPYDRPATTMAVFAMCPDCDREYHDPADRRFHAQPNACPACGPRLRLARLPEGPPRFDRLEDLPGDPVREAARRLAAGEILAVKGIGGYHLACRADANETVRKLRARKLRDGKPLAVMVPSVHDAERLARLEPADRRALESPAAPIVLAPQRPGHGLSGEVAPGVGTFGLMLPYAPIHHLLFAEGLGPLVMTSANLSGQPLTYRDEEAVAELGHIADAFLLHDREIFRPIDDSVVFTFRDAVIPIRRARGFAPRPLRPEPLQDQGPLSALRKRRILAVGGELKSAICLWRDGEAVLSEHLGDLGHPAAYRHFVKAVARLAELFDFSPEIVAHDLHPHYHATHYARGLGLPLVAVQHHHAHIAAVMAEWGDVGPVIGLACDGTGYGTDGTVWGCELLLCQGGDFERLGHLESFPLPGGDAAAVETWRPAAALLRAIYGPDWRARLPAGSAVQADPGALAIAERQMETGLNTPLTSSLGRVFDAVACLLGLCARNRHEAEAAMAVEAAAARVDETPRPWPYEILEVEGRWWLSLKPSLRALVEALAAGQPAELLAAAFHETLAQALVDLAERGTVSRGVRTVVLSGGCFANRLLLSRVVERLEQRGLEARYHREVPSGDGGLALGQAYVAAWKLAQGEPKPE